MPLHIFVLSHHCSPDVSSMTHILQDPYRSSETILIQFSSCIEGFTLNECEMTLTFTNRMCELCVHLFAASLSD